MAHATGMISLMSRPDALAYIETWLARFAESRLISKGVRIFANGEKPASLFWVASGELQLVRHTPQGERVILQRCTRGVLAEASLFSERYHCDGEAATDSMVWILPLADFQAALGHADFSRAYARWQSQVIRALRSQCERLSLPGAGDRVLHYLREHGRYDLNEGTLKTWAGALGMTHEHLYRTLAQLQRQGCIRRADREIALPQAQSDSRPTRRNSGHFNCSAVSDLPQSGCSSVMSVGRGSTPLSDR